MRALRIVMAIGGGAIAGLIASSVSPDHGEVIGLAVGAMVSLALLFAFSMRSNEQHSEPEIRPPSVGTKRRAP